MPSAPALDSTRLRAEDRLAGRLHDGEESGQTAND